MYKILNVYIKDIKCVKKDFNNLNKKEKLVREKLKIPLIFNSKLTNDRIIITK